MVYIFLGMVFLGIFSNLASTVKRRGMGVLCPHARLERNTYSTYAPREALLVPREALQVPSTGRKERGLMFGASKRG